MPQRRKHLEDKLAELDEHIESVAPLDSELAGCLQATLGDVRHAMSADARTADDHAALTDSLRDVGRRMGVSHPKLPELLEQVCASLAAVGL